MPLIAALLSAVIVSGRVISAGIVAIFMPVND
jgi:hypothetical protein